MTQRWRRAVTHLPEVKVNTPRSFSAKQRGSLLAPVPPAAWWRRRKWWWWLVKRLEGERGSEGGTDKVEKETSVIFSSHSNVWRHIRLPCLVKVNWEKWLLRDIHSLYLSVGAGLLGSCARAGDALWPDITWGTELQWTVIWPVKRLQGYRLVKASWSDCP